jgi:hypothetical protein
METLYFNRGSIELSALGLEKIGQFVQAKGTSGSWVIGIPRNQGATDQVTRGRIRTLVGALMDQGVVGVQTVYTQPIRQDGFEPMIIGILKVESFAGVDPNEDQPTAPTPPTPTKPVPLVRPPVAPGLPKAAPLSPGRQWSLGGFVEGMSNQIETPSTATLAIKPYNILGLDVNVSPGSMEFDLGYSKSAQNISSGKEQSEPTNKLDTSINATNYYSQLRVAVGFKSGRVPLRFSYLDETSSTTAVLSKGTLLIDQTGGAWVSIVDGVNFAYKTNRKTYALDWLFGISVGSEPNYTFGIHFDKAERPLSVVEQGTYSNNLIYDAKYDGFGIQGLIRPDPWREGFHFASFEIKAGHSKGLDIIDRYHILNMDVSNHSFNEFNVKFNPYYLGYFGSHGFVRVMLPLEYVSNSFKTQKVTQSNGDSQEAGLFGSGQRYGIKIDLGLRY